LTFIEIYDILEKNSTLEGRKMKKKVLAMFLVMAVMFTMFAFPAAANRWEGFTAISTPEQLSRMTSNGNYYLTRDINLRDWGIWRPLAHISFPFTGTLDGNGFFIRNMTTTSGGLFDTLRGATIRNLGLVNVDVRNNGFVGALANRASSSTIENCFVTGNVVSNDWMGGLPGL
jgi:hypothetical protein